MFEFGDEIVDVEFFGVLRFVLYFFEFVDDVGEIVRSGVCGGGGCVFGDGCIVFVEFDIFFCGEEFEYLIGVYGVYGRVVGVYYGVGDVEFEAL